MSKTEVKTTPEQSEHEKVQAEIALLIARTLESGKRTKWYEVTIVVAMTLAIVAVTKLFL